MKRLVISLILVLFLVSFVSAGWWNNVHTKTYPLWHEKHCSFFNKCPAGEGDCDNNAQCLTKLCSQNVGLNYEQDKKMDVCECATGKMWDETIKSCIVKPACTDSDGGLNYALRGEVINSDGTISDSCNGNKLTEWICSINGEQGIDEEYYDCASEGKICKDGACYLESVFNSLCGDKSCNKGESCSTCSIDCGYCAPPTSGIFVVGMIYDKTIGTNDYKISIVGDSISKWSAGGNATILIYYPDMILADSVTLDEGDSTSFAKLLTDVKANDFQYKSYGIIKKFYSAYLEFEQN